MAQAIGIDLGTLFSCVAAVREGKAVVLTDASSRTTTPSCVALLDEKEVVGEAAKRHAVTDPSSTIIAVKRLLGHPFDSEEVRRAADRLPYPLKASPLGSVLLNVGGRELTPVQISARILQQLRELAEEALGEPVRQAVISVPAHYNDVQRKATKLAADYAGLEVLRLINEPTAAAFAYGYKKAQDFTLAVYDLGGGTFDVTIMKAIGDCFSVVATDGDSFLGGEDIDRAVAEWLEDRFREEHGSDLSEDPSARLRVKEAAEKAKVELASAEVAQIDLPFLTLLPSGDRPSFSHALTREQLNELARPILETTLESCQRCLEAAGVQRGGIDEVLLVGGQSRMLLVREMVRDFFGKEPRRDINPDEVVALGASLYAYSLVADDLKFGAEEAAGDSYAVALRATDVARKLVDEVQEYQETHEHRVRTLNGDALAQRLKSLLKETQLDDAPAPREPRSSDADLPEAVDGLHNELLALDHKANEVIEKLASELEEEDSLGNLFQQTREAIEDNIEAARDAAFDAAGYLGEAQEHGSARKVQLRDVTSLPLGIASAGDFFALLIDQNTTVPVEHQRVFTTNQDGQAEVEIRVHQGRESQASQNQFLGSFILEGIAPAPRMQPKIEVSFRIDEDGILGVSARDADSGRQQAMRVEDPLGLQKVEDEPAEQDLVTSFEAEGLD